MKRKNNIFEGWYFKHQKGSDILMLIPALHAEKGGRQSASIQIITTQNSYFLTYPMEEVTIDHSVRCKWNPKEQKKGKKDSFYCKIGNNIFSEQGIFIQIETEEICLEGVLRYGKWKKPAYDMMGPFHFVPFMQCNHGVLSFSHSLAGSLKWNQKRLDFTGGKGYIEKDWGSSFPKRYLWTQCLFENNSIMLSIADIPLWQNNQDRNKEVCFLGLIGAIYYEGSEYRLATYKGAKLEKLSLKNEKQKNQICEVLIKQGVYRLKVQLKIGNSCRLHAPFKGSMNQIIEESPVSSAKYSFWCGNDLLFSVTSHTASSELVL